MVEFPPSYCPSCGNRLDGAQAPRYQCQDCGRSVFHSPSVAVQVAVVDGVGSTGVTASGDAEPRILLGERGTPPAEGRYTTPGGHVDLWERPRQAGIRELKEETDLSGDPADLKLLTVRDLTATVPEPGLTDEKQVICIDYAIRWAALDGEPVADDDIAGVRWTEVSKFPDVQWAYEDDESVCRHAIDLLSG
jgi:ADP-ribose pyrophosphatase YjhB (NUDIX family)